ncbi:hypothetical protein [Mycolicibacterium fallax]|uniref:Uncharacterized protein n=1 Tax=Mycolicibacterium fallax TaxID=1793 RepID=A0A1X1RMC6_MYCFA|nr:hypothetical protein [Mycolicibacterium fallax]ORV09699.1 hypothetical protein AWC04_01185 [Mycolicibacterium fallax]BBZ00399.1 hypothetical protein MFAL_38650 [Mycolicibacterium fallax]
MVTRISYRSLLTAGIAGVTAAALVVTPAITPPPAAEQQPVSVSVPVRHTAATVPMVLNSPLGPASAIVPPTTPPAIANLAVPGTTSAASDINAAIKSIYTWGEKWVSWGFDVATWAVSWVPWIGWFAGQIPILYDFGEAIVESIVFNLDDWIFGPMSFGTGLSNVVDDTGQAIRKLARDEINWLTGWLPPLPPLPPIGGSAARATTAGPLAAVQSSLSELTEKITALATKAGISPKLPTEFTAAGFTAAGPESVDTTLAKLPVLGELGAAVTTLQQAVGVQKAKPQAAAEDPPADAKIDADEPPADAAEATTDSDARPDKPLRRLLAINPFSAKRAGTAGPLRLANRGQDRATAAVLGEKSGEKPDAASGQLADSQDKGAPETGAAGSGASPKQPSSTGAKGLNGVTKAAESLKRAFSGKRDSAGSR